MCFSLPKKLPNEVVYFTLFYYLFNSWFPLIFDSTKFNMKMYSEMLTTGDEGYPYVCVGQLLYRSLWRGLTRVYEIKLIYFAGFRKFSRVIVSLDFLVVSKTKPKKMYWLKASSYDDIGKLLTF